MLITLFPGHLLAHWTQEAFKEQEHELSEWQDPRRFLSEGAVQLGCPGPEGSPEGPAGGECHHRTLLTQVRAHRVAAPGWAPGGRLSDRERWTEPGVTAPQEPSGALRQEFSEGSAGPE